MTDNSLASDPSNIGSQIEQNTKGDKNQVVGQVNGGIVVSVSGGGQVAISPQKNSEEKADPKVSSNKVPPLLPYMPDRKQQERELAKAVKKHLDQAHLKPLICILHGDQYQCHVEFLDRLIDSSFFEQAGLCSSDEGIRRKPIEWPNDLDRNKMKDLEYWLCNDLAKKFLNHNNSTKEEINQFFCQSPSPALINIQLLTENWQKQGDILNELLSFWHNWPKLTSGNKIIIFLLVKYQTGKKSSSQKFVFTRFFGFLINYFKCKNCQSKNKKIQAELEKLSKENFQQFSGLSGIVLPQLTGIAQSDVYNWVARDDVKKAFGEKIAEDSIMAKIDEIFQNHPSDTIPMRDLAQELTKLLKDFTVNYN
jgi:hypothetical protein